MNTIWWVLLISVLGPIIGSLIGVIKKPSERFMFNMLAFAAGVMLAISFLELIPESMLYCTTLLCVLGIIIGAMTMYSFDKIIPHIHPGLCIPEPGMKLKKTSVYLLFGIFMHNFPEGMAIAVGTVSDISISLVIALAIAIHNIPEGICTSAPYFYSTKKRLKSFLVSASTAIPIAAGFLFAKSLYQFIPPMLIGVTIAATAGLMIYISADELIPTSCSKVTHHSTIFALMSGVILVVLLGML